jgi:NAD-dependent SIR2 family protein deacetylase
MSKVINRTCRSPILYMYRCCECKWVGQESEVKQFKGFKRFPVCPKCGKSRDSSNSNCSNLAGYAVHSLCGKYHPEGEECRVL